MGFTGPNEAFQAFGVTLVGATPENGKKLLITAAALFLAWFVAWGSKRLLRGIGAPVRARRTMFWVRQGISIVLAAIVLVAIVSIWFDDPTRLTTAAGLVTAGLAFAMQRVVTAVAGYFVILRGSTFNVGDRIVMGGVRGDVIALGFMQTTVMEMGQPASVQNADPAMWVRGRHYTGRIVTISNAKIFDEPIYNYSREFPYLFEEITVPVHIQDAHRAEGILLDAARRCAGDIAELGAEDLDELCRRYFIKKTEAGPRVFWRLTDNWLELSLRFLAKDHDIRSVKDAIARQLVERFTNEGIEVASATFEVVGVPEFRLRSADGGVSADARP